MKPTTINWDRVRERLRASESALQAALAESPERIAEAYRSRAERLARGTTESHPVTAGLAALVFWLEKEHYAIALEELAEVLPFERCTPVPGAPSPFRGVINVRGAIRTVVDLRALLLGSESDAGESGFVLMLRRPGREIGLQVDHIEELREIRLEELRPPVEQNYLKGFTSGALMLLSVEAVLAAVFSKEGVVTS